MRKRTIPGHIPIGNEDPELGSSSTEAAANNTAPSQDVPSSQSQLSTRKGPLTGEQKYKIERIVLRYCPRVTNRSANEFGLFVTPEAPDIAVAVFYRQNAYLKMAIEIIKAAAQDRFDAADGQKFARL